MKSSDWNRLHRDRCRLAEAKYRERHADQIRERAKHYRETFKERHPETIRNHSLDWNKNHSEKKRAENTARRKCVKEAFCEFCGSMRNLIMHHPDYGLPEIIVTSCAVCHKYIHLGTAKP